MNFKPLKDLVVVELKSETESLTPGGILVPLTVTSPTSTGVVKAVGPGKYVNGVLVPVSVAVGDTIVFRKVAVNELNVGQEKVQVINDDNILGIVS